ncbi:hypothetical protein JMA39_14770 [Shewanella schlegeliana]|uniref:Uncharacterized protein n=2 Tax=Shewanella schlegeliana TaxID=190308 RepID=A0ABS1T0R3_9GAMM|nr:hypothetical protein [Shewanella schlegeliana]
MMHIRPLDKSTMPIKDEYYVFSNDYSKVNFVVNMNDSRRLGILRDQAISTNIPASFECKSLKTFKPIEAVFDISVSTKLLFDMDYAKPLVELDLYNNSLVPAKIVDKDYLYLHCYNIINILDDEVGFDFEELNAVALENRLVFRPSFESIIVFFHKSVIDAIESIKKPSYAKPVKVADWTMELEMS